MRECEIAQLETVSRGVLLCCTCPARGIAEVRQECCCAVLVLHVVRVWLK